MFELKIDRTSRINAPFKSKLVSVYGIYGLNPPPESEAGRKLCLTTNSTHSAFLMQDAGGYLKYKNVAPVLSYLLFTGMTGAKRHPKLQKVIDWVRFKTLGIHSLEQVIFKRTLRFVNESTREKKRNYSSYLVCVSESDVQESFQPEACIAFDRYGMCLEEVPNEGLNKAHKKFTSNMATVLASEIIAQESSFDIHLLDNSPLLVDSKGREIFCFELKGGSVGVSISTVNADERLQLQTQTMLEVFKKHQKVEKTTQLYVQSKDPKLNTVVAFLSAWTALEQLVNYVSRLNRPQAIDIFKSRPSLAVDWEKNLAELPPECLNLKDRFLLVSLLADPSQGLQEAIKFKELNKKRSSYVHELKGSAEDLPTKAAQELYLKYFRWLLTSNEYEN